MKNKAIRKQKKNRSSKYKYTPESERKEKIKGILNSDLGVYFFR